MLVIMDQALTAAHLLTYVSKDIFVSRGTHKSEG